MSANNIKGIIRGDTRRINVQVLDQDKITPFNLTNCEVFFTVSAENDPTSDSQANIKLDSITNPEQVVISNPDSGLISIKLVNADTQSFAVGTYYYDIQIKDSFNNIISQPQAKITIVADISRRTV